MADEPVDIDLFISLMEQKPVLWDKTMELYKNRIATQAAWKDIMNVLNPGFETMEEKRRQDYAKLIIRKWTHIRDSYHRCIKKIKDQKRSGNSAKTAKPYIYSKQLSFLQKTITPNETVNNLVTENNKAVSGSQENYVETNEGTEINTNQAETNDTATKNQIPKPCIPKRHTMNNVNPVDAKMIKFMDSFSYQEPKVTNRHLSFFNGILPTLDKFDDNEVLEFQMGVLQLLKNIKNSRQNPNLPSFNADLAGSLSSHPGYLTQEYPVNSNSSTTNSSTIDLITVQAPLQTPPSVASSYSNYSDIVD